jgi:outer membrane immunogenic protein
LVIGLEADISFTDLKALGTDAMGFNHTIESTWLSTGTARVGYATGPWLLYGKGGIALADERNTVTDPATGLSAVGPLWSSFHIGWTVGGGVEYALTRNWSARIEYDYIDFNNVNLVSQNPNDTALTIPFTTLPASANVNWTIQRVVGAVNYRF